MSASHARTGVCAVAVVGTVGVVPWANPVAVLLAGGLVVGGSIAPDLDHPSSSPSRAFGAASRVLSGALQAASGAAYGLTRGDRDPRGRRAHRTLTHSALGCVLLGALFALLCSTDTAYGPIPAAVGVGLLTGLGVHALMGSRQWKRRDGQVRAPKSRKRRRVRRFMTRDQWKWTSALAAGGLVMTSPEVAAGWWPWWLGAALTLGMAVHCAGDAMTDVGIPWCWPLLREGRRWRHRWLLPAPLRFTTEHTGERVAMGLITLGTVGFCLAVLTGPSWWPVVTG